MKYNEKYDLYLDEDFVIYYWDKRKDKLMQRTMSDNGCGYLRVRTKLGLKMVHRIIWETFNGEIPDGYEIDHINTIKTDNRLDNLRLVTPKENKNNPLTLIHLSKAMKGRTAWNKEIPAYNKGKPVSVFGIKFKEHYEITKSDNPKLYCKEYAYYQRHNKCSWE